MKFLIHWCTDIYAVNKLLLDNPDARIIDILTYGNRTSGTSKSVY